MDLKTVHTEIHRHKRKKRLGRGAGSKKGRTAGRGNKGQRATSGDLPTLLKEGGQMPLFRRLPKRGFNNQWAIKIAVVNVVDLGNFDDGTVVTPELLKDARLAQKSYGQLKILGDGELSKKLEVHAHAFSASAKAKIEGAGGKCVVLAAPARGPKIKNKMRPRKPKHDIG